MSTKDDLIHEIGGMIVADPKIAGKAWDGLALVAHVSADSRGMHGFRFWDDDFEATNPREASAITRRLADLRGEMARETGDEWHQVLIHVWRPGPEIRMQFEYDDPGRWKPRITGLDMSEYAHSIRPPTK